MHAHKRTRKTPTLPAVLDTRLPIEAYYTFRRHLAARLAGTAGGAAGCSSGPAGRRGGPRGGPGGGPESAVGRRRRTSDGGPRLELRAAW